MATAPTQLTASALVAIGGAAGAVLRYQLGRGTTRVLGLAAIGAFPWGTLAANVLGSLGMGLLVGVLARAGQGGETWRLLIGVGLLGGFTTFSSFSLETVLLVERGAPALALAYVAASLVGGCAGLWIGLATLRAAA